MVHLLSTAILVDITYSPPTFATSESIDLEVSFSSSEITSITRRLPDHVSYEEAALLEPLSVGVHACKKGGLTIGKKVLILGSGSVGLATTLTALHMGADRVLVTGNSSKKKKIVGTKNAN